MRVIHINKSDFGGGAEQVASDFILSDPDSRLMVKNKKTANDRVRELPDCFWDDIFFTINRAFYFFGMKMNIRSKLFLNESFNCTIDKLRKSPEYKLCDIVHLHNIHGGYFDLYSLKQISREKKIVWSLHDMWAITGGEAHTFDFSGYRTGYAKSPFFKNYPLNEPWIDGRQSQMNLKKSIYQEIAHALVMVPVSFWLERKIRESYVYNDQLKLTTIHNGIDTNFFENMDQRIWTMPRVLFFNSNNPFKGSLVFAQAIKKIKYGCEIRVVGDDLLCDSEFVKLKHVALQVGRNEMVDLYNQVDILVFPSLAENLSLTILEAMSCGVCVLASDVGGSSEIINSDDVGVLFKSGDIEHLSDKLNKLLCDITVARLKGMKASIRIDNEFSIQKMLMSYNELYNKIGF